MSGDGAWYGAGDQQPAGPRRPADQPFPPHSFADEPTAPQPLVPQPLVPQPQPGVPAAPAEHFAAEHVPAEQAATPAVQVAATPRRHRDLGAGIAIGLVVLMALCIGAVGSTLHVFAGASDEFEAGACVTPDAGEDPPYRVAECADPAATHTVVGVLDRDAGRPCRDIAGASKLFSTDAAIVCLGDKGVDPAKAVNVAKEGDCVNVENRAAVRIDCRDPGAKFQVTKRLTDVAENTTGGACAGVPGVVETYSWNWTSSDPIDRLDNSVDVVLCLGPSQSSIEAAASASAARSNCRFLTDAEISAAASTATNRTHTVSKHADDGTHCAYQFAKPREVVRVGFFSGVAFKPGTGSEVFTLDGLRAMWNPGQGDRSLGVELPSGVIYISVQMSGVGDSTSRKLAIAAFRSARARLT